MFGTGPYNAENSTWSPSPAGSQGYGYVQRPSQSPEYSRRAARHQMELAQHQRNIIRAIRHFDSYGFTLEQLMALREPKIKQAFTILNATPEDDIKLLYGSMSSRLRYSHSRTGTSMTSHSVTSRYASGVPSLISDHSQASVSTMSTDFNMPVGDTARPNLGWHPDAIPAAFSWISSPNHLHPSVTREGLQPLPAIPSFPSLMDDINVQKASAIHGSLLTDVGFGQNATLDVDAADLQANMQTFYDHEEATPFQQGPIDHTDPIFRADQGRTQNPKTQYPCPEDNCDRVFVNTAELRKHLVGDHDRDVTYTCNHQGCLTQTNRREMSKRHHSTVHRYCKGKDGTCVRKLCTKQRRHWGCGFCVALFEDAGSHVEHYKTHIDRDNVDKRAISFETIIWSLLQQNATRDQWNTMHNTILTKERMCSFMWEPATCENIRHALEYGVFKGNLLSEPGVAEDLVLALLALRRNNSRTKVAAVPESGHQEEPAPEGGARSALDEFWAECDYEDIMDVTNYGLHDQVTIPSQP